MCFMMVSYHLDVVFQQKSRKVRYFRLSANKTNIVISVFRRKGSWAPSEDIEVTVEGRQSSLLLSDKVIWKPRGRELKEIKAISIPTVCCIEPRIVPDLS